MTDLSTLTPEQLSEQMDERAHERAMGLIGLLNDAIAVNGALQKRVRDLERENRELVLNEQMNFGKLAQSRLAPNNIASAMTADPEPPMPHLHAAGEALEGHREGSIKDLLAKIEAKRAAMNPADRAKLEAEERQAQRESWVRGMGPCDHGNLDWEQCSECMPGLTTGRNGERLQEAVDQMDGWIEHDGGARPVAADARVQAKRRDGLMFDPCDAVEIAWFNSRWRLPEDITHYRIIGEGE